VQIVGSPLYHTAVLYFSTSALHLGHSLGIRVSAEGIETNEQLVALRALACDTACGYLLARPLPADEVTALIAAGTPLA
jgi:EAL domain-containing protein (putative c-di-GMP-specific phosphodiesterase class I)